MRSFWVRFLGMALSLTTAVQAQDQAQFIFRGQADEHVKLERTLTETRTRTEMRDSTCTRQVPYEAEECGPETRYREGCRWVPEHEECDTRYEQQCSTVTRYRQECYQGPSRRECRYVPGEDICHRTPDRRVCRDVPGPRQCRTIPGEEVCSPGTPEREQCRTLPNGQQECRTIPGREPHCVRRHDREECWEGPSRQECYTDPGEVSCRRGPDRQECYDVPGEDICHSVPYQDQECQDVPVPYCYNVPGQNVCEQIPYQENVCRTVTRHRAETYACKEPVQVPYEVKVSLQGQLDVKFLNPDFGKELNFTASVGTNRTLSLAAQTVKDVLVGTRPGAPRVVVEGETVTIQQKIDVKLANVKDLQAQLAQGLADVVIDFKAKKLTFSAKGLVEAVDMVEIELEGKKRELFSTKTGVAKISGSLQQLAAVITPAQGGNHTVQIDLSRVDVSKIVDKKNFKMKLKHVKGLPAGFGWAGEVPALQSNVEATARAVK